MYPSKLPYGDVSQLSVLKADVQFFVSKAEHIPTVMKSYYLKNRAVIAVSNYLSKEKPSLLFKTTIFATTK